MIGYEYISREQDTATTSLLYQLFGTSRAWKAIEMIGLNEFSPADVVATFSGEGVADYADGRGFIFTNYHCADNEPMCCPSDYAINYFRPGPAGWTLIAKYDFARAKSNDE